MTGVRIQIQIKNHPQSETWFLLLFILIYIIIITYSEAIKTESLSDIGRIGAVDYFRPVSDTIKWIIVDTESEKLK